MNDFTSLPPMADYNVATNLGEPASQSPENPFEIFNRVHRLLRGRYLFAIVFGTVGALAGAMIGYKATVPKYQSVGMIRIKATKTLVYQLPDQMTGNTYVRSVAQLLQVPRVIDRAMLSEEWKRVGRGLTEDAKEVFKDSLHVDTDPGATEWIYVRFTDTVPKVAQVAVEQIIQAYLAIHGDDDVVVYPELIQRLQNKVTTYEGDISVLQSQIKEIGIKFGTTDLESMHEDSLEQLKELEREYGRLELRIKLAEAAQDAPREGIAPAPEEPDPDAVAAEMARTDDTAKSLVAHLSDAQSYLDLLVARGFTEEHPSVKKARATVAGMRNHIQGLAKKWLAQHGGIAAGEGNAPTGLGPEELKSAKVYFETVSARRDALQKRTLTLNEARLEIADLADQIKKKQLAQADVDRRLTVLTTESGGGDASGVSGRINIISTGEESHRPSSDSRKKLAALGFIFGGGLPLGLVLLWGIIDPRYRYSDDASSGPIHPTLLGILPFLPDDVSEPEQAAVAAHCVHQIRTLLQISAAQTGKRVFAVTSPTAGDGKTSLSMSLALSFASSGASTCLIDFDLIGCGLTSAMNVKTEVGLMDAVQRADLNGQIRPSGFKRLSIVPAGLHDAALVATLSPESVRRVIKQAREKFDVVIIDTGPILGSLEASLVTSAADGVILTLGRGQSRSLADRAMKHLFSVGATLMGVVFNRAESGDFRRAISSASVRSVPAQVGLPSADTRTLPALGPMARTVARQVRPSDAPPHDH